MPWEHINLWPPELTAIHAAHLPNNRVAMWGFGVAGSNTECPAWVLNLLALAFVRVDCTVNNVFCGGHAMLTDGRVLVAGGTDMNQPDNGEGFGTRFATLLVPDDQTVAGARWVAAQPMGTVNPDDARWYPTNTHLADGRQLVLSGTTHLTPPPNPRRVYNQKVQLYNPADDSWFTAPINQQLPLYPAMFVLPLGDVFYAGRDITPTPPGDKTLALRLSDYTWHVVTEGQSEGAIGEHNSACMFAPGKVLRCGGDDPSGLGASRLAAMIDLSNWQVGQPAPSWQTVAPMNHPRRDHNLIPLLGRLVLAIGGQATKDYSQPVMTPEVLDTTNPTAPWVDWDAPPDPSFDPRTYHSIAFLLLSGRIFIAGGQKTQTTTYPSGDIYTPPVIANESERPVINTAPASIQYGVQFSVGATLFTGRTVTDICLISYACVTHGFDQHTRCVPLAFSQSGLGVYDVVAPPNANHAPPGYYMLFVADDTGSYSEATMVHLSA